MAAKPIHQLCCGYSCQFVEELPKELQTECSICLHTVREPYLVDCCGYRFCKTCIDPVKRCPLCNGQFSSVIPDKLLQRTLNQKLVYCTHKLEGCLWIGQLSKVEEHQIKCPRKPVTCEFCKKYQAPKEKMKQHQKSCPARFIVCPNGCGGMMKPSSLKTHTEKKCPLSVVSCEFAYAGCLSLMCRQDMKSHLEAAAQEHFVLLSDKVKKMEKGIKRLKTDNAAKNKKIKKLQKSLLKLKLDLKTSSVNQLVVSNFPPYTDEHVIKSFFGTFGLIKSIQWDADEDVAFVEYVESRSVTQALERHRTVGIILRGKKLDVN